MRSKEEILIYIRELREEIRDIKVNSHKYQNKEIMTSMLKENLHRIHTLEWVLGQHDRFD